VTGRALSVVAALMLAPGLARSDPGSPEPKPEPQGQQGGTAPSEATKPKVPPELANRADFTLTLTTLDALHKKGMMTDEEYNAALRDLISVGMKAATSPTFVLARFVTTFYGYLEGDVIHDSQRVVTDGYGGHPTLNLNGTFAGDNGRTVFGSRGTRLGFRFAAPAVEGVRVRGLFEMDFVGNQPINPASPATRAGSATSLAGTEANFFTNPTARLRHGLLQVETDIVTLWVGQTWNLMAFEAAYLPTSVQTQGLPGQLFGRNPQVRLSKTVDLKAVSVEVAGAAVRPPQMDSEIPDLQGGLKINVPTWTGVQSIGSTATTISPLSVAVTGAYRWFKLANATTFNGVATGTNQNATTNVNGSVIAVDAFIPVIRATQRGTPAFSLLGEYTKGSGYADLFSGLSGGAAINAPTGVTTAQYAQFVNIDAGNVGWDTSGILRTINWRTVLLDAQFSVGNWVLAGNYSNVYSDNMLSFTGANWYQQVWWDVNLIWDPWPGVRFGLEYARSLQRKVPSTNPSSSNKLANNSRVMFAGFFLF